VALGLVTAFAAGRVIQGLLYEVPSHDPITFVWVPALLLLIVLIACAIPARRATRVDPVIALRYE